MFNIREVALFKTLSPADEKEIRTSLSNARYKRKQVIFSEGDAPEWFYIVRRGKVKITKLSTEGKEIILEIIGPNDFFGAVAVIRNFPYPANAVAMEETEIIKISRKNLMSFLDRFPSLMFFMASSIGERVKGSHEALKSIALEKVESRMASLLVKLADKAGEKTPEGLLINMKLTKQDLADMVGTTVETSIRTMSKFSKTGIVSYKTGKIVIRDIETLRSLA